MSKVEDLNMAFEFTRDPTEFGKSAVVYRMAHLKTWNRREVECVEYFPSRESINERIAELREAGCTIIALRKFSDGRSMVIERGEGLGEDQ